MYCKLFTSLYQGTLRGKSDEILVFTNLLAHCDSEGYVDKHWRAISEEVGIPEDRVKAAITSLETPDPESRSPAEEGRRITRIDDHRAWGWQVTNYIKYREIKNLEDRREQNREAQARWRSKQKKVSSVSTNKQSKPMQMQYAEAEVEATAFGQFWKAYPKKKAKGAAERAFKKYVNVEIVVLIDAVNRQKQSKDWIKDGGQFIPNPATWIHDRGWENEEMDSTNLNLDPILR